MIRVDSSYGFDDAIVESDEPGVTRIGRLVHWVISRNPSIVLVMPRELFPEPNGPVLEILVPPEVCEMDTRIAMPATILRVR